MPDYRPSDELVQSRLHYLIERDGRAAVASRYGVGQQTVQNWVRGRTSPGSADTARSIARRGREITGPVIQNRQDGRFTTEGQITDARAVAYVRSMEERNIRTRQLAIEEATTPSSRAAAEAMPVGVDLNLARDLDSRRQGLIQAGVTGDDTYWNDEGQFYDSWDAWRDELEGSYGMVPS